MQAIGAQAKYLGRIALCAALAVTVTLTTESRATASPFADSCGVLRESVLAKAFGQSNVVKHSFPLRTPGNSAGVLRAKCLSLAWTGRKPSGASQERRAVAAGMASSLRIETWVADEGPFASNWRANFPAKVQGLTSRARRAFTEGSRPGRVISLAKLGAEHRLGFLAASGSLVKVRAFWWNETAASIVSMSVVEAKGMPVVGSVSQVAGLVVPAIH